MNNDTYRAWAESQPVRGRLLRGTKDPITVIGIPTGRIDDRYIEGVVVTSETSLFPTWYRSCAWCAEHFEFTETLPLPKLNIRCECDAGDGVHGSTYLDVVRVDPEDDGSFTAVTNHWPRPAPDFPPDTDDDSLSNVRRLLAELGLEHSEARRLLVSFLKERGVLLKADAPWDVLSNAAVDALGDWGKGPAVWRDLELGEEVKPGDRWLSQHTHKWELWGSKKMGYVVNANTTLIQRRVLPPTIA